MEDRFTLPVVQILKLPLYNVAAHSRILHVKNFSVQNTPSQFPKFQILRLYFTINFAFGQWLPISGIRTGNASTAVFAATRDICLTVL